MLFVCGHICVRAWVQSAVSACVRACAFAALRFCALVLCACPYVGLCVPPYPPRLEWSNELGWRAAGLSKTMRPLPGTGAGEGATVLNLERNKEIAIIIRSGTADGLGKTV